VLLASPETTSFVVENGEPETAVHGPEEALASSTM
jgi:hypothetical protein